MVVSLGCAKNLVDTEVMCGALAVGGYALTNVPEDADILLINTCSFIADARSEAEEEIRDAVRWRKQDRRRRLVVAGCLPQRDHQDTAKRFRGVDLFLGLDDVPKVATLFNSLYDNRPGRQVADFPLPTYLYDSRAPRLQLTPGNYAYVKIAEGCDHLCAFCAIPGIRGRQRSRAMDDVLDEARQLLDSGVAELDLIAQDSSRYGSDRDDGASLAKLVAACDQELAGDFWLRILYTHPRFFGDDLIAAYRDSRHLVPYVDIPLQHIASPVLKRMGRRVDERQTRELMGRLRSEIPGVAIRTTFLVGFPGETEADFALLREFVREFRFDRLGVFAYSPEEGTPAAKIAEEIVPGAVAAARRDELMAMQQDISLAKNQQQVGRTLKVLVEGTAADGKFIGRTAADAPDVDNLVTFQGPEDCVGRKFVDVEILQATAYDLAGLVA